MSDYESTTFLPAEAPGPVVGFTVGYFKHVVAKRPFKMGTIEGSAT